MKFSILSFFWIIFSLTLLMTGILDIIGIIHLKEHFPYLFINRFLDLPSFLIVMGGLLTNAFIIYPSRLMRSAFAKMGQTFHQSINTQKVLQKDIESIVTWSNEYKTNRLEFLRTIQDKQKHDFTSYLFSLISTNYSIDEVRVIGETSIDENYSNSHKVSEVLKNMGNSGPAFGMFGTLFGLVYMLSSLDDPSKIGPGLATGLLVTLYGVTFTHLFFYPVSKKIMLSADYNKIREELMLEGVQLIAENKSPLFIKDKLQTYLDRSYTIKQLKAENKK
jgi:chemotaxis protein MotA